MQNIHVKSNRALIPFEEKMDSSKHAFLKKFYSKNSRLNNLISYIYFRSDLNYLLRIYDMKIMHIKIWFNRKNCINHIHILNQIQLLDLIRFQNSLSYHGSMISTVDKYDTRFFLMSSSRTDCPTSIDRPLKALIGTSFSGVLARVEGSG